MSGLAIHKQPQGFRATSYGGSPSAALEMLIQRICAKDVGTTLSDEVLTSAIESGLDEARKESGLPLGLGDLKQLTLLKQRARKIAGSAFGDGLVASETTSIAHALLSRLAEKSELPDELFPAITGGIGLKLHSQDREAYFEIRLDPIRKDRVQGLLFLTRFDKRGQNNILHLHRDNKDEAYLVDQALRFIGSRA